MHHGGVATAHFRPEPAHSSQEPGDCQLATTKIQRDALRCSETMRQGNFATLRSGEVMYPGGMAMEINEWYIS